MQSTKNILLKESSLQEHIDSQNSNYNEYMTNLTLLFDEYNYDFTIIKLAKILTTSLIRQDKSLAEYLLKKEKYDLPVILKTCEILDSRRLYNQLDKKTDKIKNKKKLSKHKTILANLQALNEGINMSLTNAKINFIRDHWIRQIPKEKLEYMALLYPTNHWKRLIDLFHLKPSDFQLDWFSVYIFSNEYPKNSIIHICKTIEKENIKKIISQYQLPYDFLRLKYKKLLAEDVMETIFDYTPLHNIIRHWESFNTKRNMEMIMTRINNGETIDMPYGELMKRIQMLNQDDNSKQLVEKLLSIAENYLLNYKMEIDQPVVVLGDASSSMDIAIRTSSIITSILARLCQAKMHLFRSNDEVIENPPTNVKEVLESMSKYKAYGTTSPVASLVPYYKNKEVVKTFVIVTDEIENSDEEGNFDFKGGFFAKLFKEYREHVYPSKLVFVSFLENNKDGPMVASLKREIPEIEKDIIQFRMNVKKPDLRKLDELLRVLDMYTSSYENKYNNLLSNITQKDNEKDYMIKVTI